jgi:hypothetical protein
MASIPDVVGAPLSRAQELMGAAGVNITDVATLDTPDEWKPRNQAADIKTEPYVIIQHPSGDGDSVELTVVNAWAPPEH